MVSRSSPNNQGSNRGSGAVAQSAQASVWLDTACLICFAVATLGLAAWALRAVLLACGGSPGAPLDDSYIHFQFATGFARFRPLEYTPGLPRVAGATSLLWPMLLMPAVWLGASGGGLIASTWLLGFAALFGQSSEIYLAARRFLSRPLAFAAGLLVLAFSANTWFAASAMEVVPLGFLLLRSARRAAEFVEGQRDRWRRRELMLLALSAVLLRPEGALAVLCVAAALALSGKWGRALAALALLLVPPSLNLLFADSATQTTTLAKWLPLNPYYSGRLGTTLLANVGLLFETLLDGRQWSWTFIPEGYRALALASLPALWLAAERKRARAHAAFLLVVAFGMLLPTTYETFLVNRLRYLWPFSAPWLLGLAALGELLALPLARVRPQLALAGLALPLFAGYGFAQLAPISVADLAESAAAITAQQVSLGRWAADHLPKNARLGVNDAGAIAYYSERPTFDVVGLTTRGEARYWVAGAGSRFEHYERLKRTELPTHFIVYPEWFAIPSLLGECLTERRVDGATILGGPVMVACEANYASLGSGARPTIAVGSRRLLDELDVADLESEQAHSYLLGPASAQDNVVVSLDGRQVDGGRARRLNEDFRIELAAGGRLVIRFSSTGSGSAALFAADKPLASLPIAPGTFQELVVEVPPEARSGQTRIALRSALPLTLLHYWSFGPP